MLHLLFQRCSDMCRSISPSSSNMFGIHMPEHRRPGWHSGLKSGDLAGGEDCYGSAYVHIACSLENRSCRYPSPTDLEIDLRSSSMRLKGNESTDLSEYDRGGLSVDSSNKDGSSNANDS